MTEAPNIIWLVEDEQAYAESLIYILDNVSGLHCKKHFFSSEELFEYIGSPLYTQAPDLILMDIHFAGGQSGIEAVRNLRKAMKNTPVVMMTMYDDRRRIMDAMKAGAVGYIVKGSPFDQVIDEIREALKGRLLLAEPIRNKFLNQLHDDSRPKAYDLTVRQLEVLALMCEGLSKADIARRLTIRHATADNHFRHIYERLGVNSAHAAVALALKEGLVPLE